MNLKYVLIFSLILVIFLYGCSKEVSDQTNLTTLENQTIQSCDDDNPCTEDYFDNETQSCNSKRLDHCCGDNFCDSDERCDDLKHETKCKQDCPRKCPAYLVVNNFTCVGGCNDTGDGYIINGYARLKTKLENIGELPLYSLSANFGCRDINNREVYSSNMEDYVKGVNVRDYFGSGQKTVALTSNEFNKENVDYTIEFLGVSQQEQELHCFTQFSASDYYTSISFNINMTEEQVL